MFLLSPPSRRFLGTFHLRFLRISTVIYNAWMIVGIVHRQPFGPGGGVQPVVSREENEGGDRPRFCKD